MMISELQYPLNQYNIYSKIMFDLQLESELELE